MNEMNYGVALLPAAARAGAQLRKWSGRERCGGRRGRLDGGGLRRLTAVVTAADDGGRVALGVLDDFRDLRCRNRRETGARGPMEPSGVEALHRGVRFARDPHAGVSRGRIERPPSNPSAGHGLSKRPVDHVPRLAGEIELFGRRLRLLERRLLAAADREDGHDDDEDDVLEVHFFLFQFLFTNVNSPVGRSAMDTLRPGASCPTTLPFT